MPAYNTKITCDPQTKQEWSELLAYLYAHWRIARLPVTVYPSGWCKGALRLQGIIGGKRIGSIVH